MSTTNYYFVYSYTHKKDLITIGENMSKTYVPIKVFAGTKWKDATRICKGDNEYEKFVKRYGDGRIVLTTTDLSEVKYIDSYYTD